MSGLNRLHDAELHPEAQALLDAVAAEAGGHRVFRERKLREARALLALAQVAGRLRVQSLDLTADLRVILELRVPVPCRDAGGELRIAGAALLGLRYPPEALVQPMPGAAFVQLLRPLTCFHPNVQQAPLQAICLAPQLPPGIRVPELVLMTYRALALQDCTFDVADPAGVFRADAAEWWQAHGDRMPLTEEPFLPGPAMSTEPEEAL